MQLAAEIDFNLHGKNYVFTNLFKALFSFRLLI